MSSHSRSDSTSEENEQQSIDSSAEQQTANDSGPTTTVMIYLAGDNNLTDECIYALTELRKAQASPLVKIYVQFDPSDEFLATQRYEINQYGKEHHDTPLALDLIDKYPFAHESKKCLKIKAPYGEQRERKGESGTGDPRMLYNFVAFCVDEPHKPHPQKTDHYVLIICGHGAGIQRDFLLRDDRPDGYLTIYELRAALRLMRKELRGKDPYKRFKLDLFGMDVCLMSMAEVTYELRDVVDIAIGCESYSPAAGWPYFKTIKQIDTQAKSREAFSGHDTWERIAANIVTEYVSFYSDYWLGGLSVSMSALRVTRVRDLQRLVRALADQMLYKLGGGWDRKHFELGKTAMPVRHEELKADKGSDDQWKRKRYPPLVFSDALILAHWRTQSYNGELYIDLADFCDCLAEYMPEGDELARICRELSNFIKEYFVIKSCTFGRNYQYSYGVSIYFPWQTLIPYYGASIRFPQHSHWIYFLDTYLKVTRRQPRWFFDCEPHGDGAHLEWKDKRVNLNELLDLNLDQVRMGPDRMGPDRMGMDEGGNPIHSMRNPPIVFIPDCCTTLAQRVINAYWQAQLMQDSLQLKEMLLDPKVEELEKKNPAWPLLTQDLGVNPDQFEADNEDES